MLPEIPGARPIPYNLINKPFKKIMAEQKYAFLTSDPENINGHDMIREKFGLAPPNQFKYGRSQGGISNIELEKLGIGQRNCEKTNRPKRILPKQFRDDPFADPPPITENDIADGMLSLLNRGIIPRDVDLSPAFERNSAPFAFNRAPIHNAPFRRPPQLSKTVSSPKSGLKQSVAQILPQPNVDTTFLTQMGGNPNIQEHLNRISQPPMPGSTAGKSGGDSRAGLPQSSGGGAANIANRIDTASDNAYAIVPKRDEDDLL